MQEIKFNMNDYVKVKLNEYGKECYRKYFEKVMPMLGYQLKAKIDEDGYYKDQLHIIFTIFGQYMTLGFLCPFDTDIILVVEDK
jgi:hypothetical protein